MKHYFRRLRKAIKWENYYPYYYTDDPYPTVWELDYFIVNMVRVNLPNYNHWHPANLKEEEWEKIRTRLIELSEKICEWHKLRFKFWKILEEKQWYSMQDLADTEKEFAKLLWENLFHLRD